MAKERLKLTERQWKKVEPLLPTSPKSKRGGINCIASCIFWNVHELEKGTFDFSGERDLG